MNRQKMTLQDLGYTEHFQQQREQMGFSSYGVGRVIAEYREAYRIKNDTGEYLGKITGKQMYRATTREDYPAVGDWVAITELPHNQATIHGIFPRISLLQKKYRAKRESQIIATNIDTAFIVEALDRDYNLNRIERYVVLTNQGKIQAVVILNKRDLLTGEEYNEKITQLQRRFPGMSIITTSTRTGSGISELQACIQPQKTYCFLGSSGVGKSSLINELLGSEEIQTREISITLERGRHTTTTREMYSMKGGGLLIDNPGTREVGLAGADVGGTDVFDEITMLSRACKFTDCTHTNEPGCAVRSALETKALDDAKFENYRKLKKESDFYKLTDVEKREKDRKFGKMIKRVLKDMQR